MPPKKKSTTKGRPRKAVTQFRDIGPPPEDALERSVWFGEMVATAAYQVATDTGIKDESERRTEILKHARVYTGLVPFIRLKKAEDLIIADQKALYDDSDRPLDDAPSKHPSAIRGASRRGRKPKRKSVH